MALCEERTRGLPVCIYFSFSENVIGVYNDRAGDAFHAYYDPFRAIRNHVQRCRQRKAKQAPRLPPSWKKKGWMERDKGGQTTNIAIMAIIEVTS